MKSHNRNFIFFGYLFISFVFIYLFGFVILSPDWMSLIIDWSFWLTLVMFVLSIEETYHWTRNGRRSEMSDIIAIIFFFSLIFFFTKDLLTAIMGAFSIYLLVGVFELKEYPILNKILIISLVTYNAIFIAGILSFYFGNPIFINTTFSFSIWIILGLGLLLFGRKYIIVWRFMSPQYLMLFLYIIAWLAISLVEQYSPIDFVYGSPIKFPLNLLDFFLNVYFVLMIVNWVVYFVSGPILDKFLGIKKVKSEDLLDLVEEVKIKLGIKGKIKIGFGKYPILNAMAYGSVFDKRIAIIAEDLEQIPQDELKGIVAHELGHTKGKHTLILTLITCGDLVFRMILGIPATYYDYTFGNPVMPMIVFIMLNVLIYAIIYIFVRILEGKADLKTKQAGYATHLVKALYNLESFYASGREIGLNTMLLCEEKITRDNKMLDYMETAEYLNRSLVKPSRTSLIANVLNSHPPTYFRIAAVLGENLKPAKEAFLPFICLKRSKQKKYAQLFESAREDFKGITNQKFKDLFGVDSFSHFSENLDRKEAYKLQLKKDYLFKNIVTGEIILGRLEDVKFEDDVNESLSYIVLDLKNKEKILLNSVLYKKNLVEPDETYFFENNESLVLKEIKIDENKMSGNYVFIRDDSEVVLKPILKTKLPWPDSLVKQLKGKNVFLRLKERIKIFTVINVIPGSTLDDYKLVLNASEIQENHQIELKLSDLIIVPHKISITIRKSETNRKSEIEVINWLIDNNRRCTVWLKKPVNNFEIGHINKVLNASLEKDNFGKKELNKQKIIQMTNIFKKKIEIPYSKIEQISFESDSVLIQKKNETSFLSKFGYKLLKKFRPRNVLIP
ncbi:MAG: M48 family metalloprotease [Candidatus Lokiarchaeota archaeon]|nr:M48 family metalloprotease [Candidatus Lokiarchaeota archaeon]